jgi:GTPase SAR1 family protein
MVNKRVENSKDTYQSSKINLKPQGVNLKEVKAQYKIIIIGDEGVGKSSLLLRYTDSIIDENQPPTVGAYFKIKTVKVNDDAYKL